MCRHTKTPCAGQRSANSEKLPARSPWVDLCSWSRIATGTHQLCSMTAWIRTRIQGCPHRPRSRGQPKPLDRSVKITLEPKRPLRYKCSRRSGHQGLLSRASIEHGQACLQASGSTGATHDGWWVNASERYKARSRLPSRAASHFTEALTLRPLSRLVIGLPGVSLNRKIT